MKNLFFIVCLVFGFSAFSQSAEYRFDKKTNTAFEGETALFTLKSVGAKSEGEYSVKNMSGKELIYLRTSEFKDEKEISSANPRGNVVFIEFVFYNTESRAEIGGAYFAKRWAKIIYENKLIINGELDSTSEERFIKIKGNDYSKRRDSGNNKVIIINNNTQPTPKDGVNIHIGR